MKKPTLTRLIKRAQDRATHTNFQNDMRAMERRRMYRLQLAELHGVLNDKLSPGMRDNLTHRKKKLEALVKESLRE